MFSHFLFYINYEEFKGNILFPVYLSSPGFILTMRNLKEKKEIRINLPEEGFILTMRNLKLNIQVDR